MQIRRTSAGKIAVVLAGVLWLFLFVSHGNAEPSLSRGGTVYVSIYSNLFAGPKAITYKLAAMLSIRNTDPEFSLSVTRADYYDSEGKLVKRYIKKPITLKPLGSKYFYIQEYDDTGGAGANFIVKWQSKEEINKPIIEGVMTGLLSGHGVSFRCPGQDITEHNK